MNPIGITPAIWLRFSAVAAGETLTLLVILAHALIAAAPPASRAPSTPAVSKKPPVLALKEIEIRQGKTRDGPAIHKRVRVAHPRGWTQEGVASIPRSIHLTGAEGEGELTIVAALRPDELGQHLTRLKNAHPSSAPSPPAAMRVPGIDPDKGERATRFVITGKEVGEMVMIERGGVIVLFATIVEPGAWAELAPIMERCYPTVEVIDAAAGGPAR